MPNQSSNQFNQITMNQNPPLTPEEAAKLTFPCLLEVWDGIRAYMPVTTVVMSLNDKSQFVSMSGAKWQNAALPSPEITEAMRKQFGTQSEFPKRMLVWNGNESNAKPRIVLADLGEKAGVRYIVVFEDHESRFENGESFSWVYFNHAKPIPHPDPIAQEIAELEKRIAELKSQQQSK